MKPFLVENRSANALAEDAFDLSARLNALEIKLDQLKVEAGLDAIRFCGNLKRENSSDDPIHRIETLEQEVSHACQTADLSNASLQMNLIHWLKAFRELKLERDTKERLSNGASHKPIEAGTSGAAETD